MKKSFACALVFIMSVMVVTAAVVQGGENKSKAGIVTGQLAIDGVGPMLGGAVIFFDVAAGPPPSPANYWRVPTYVFKVDDNAEFKAELPAGEYYIGAIEKRSGEPIEPPQEGEYFFISHNRSGKPWSITVRKHTTLALGLSIAAKPFSRASLAVKGITALEGTIRNDLGAPVEGILVFAFSSRSMNGKPLFVSERSDKEGRYQLRLSGGGKYYLRAQATYGDPPATAELRGVYKEGRAVPVKTGVVTNGIDITVATGATAAPQP